MTERQGEYVVRVVGALTELAWDASGVPSDGGRPKWDELSPRDRIHLKHMACFAWEALTNGETEFSPQMAWEEWRTTPPVGGLPSWGSLEEEQCERLIHVAFLMWTILTGDEQTPTLMWASEAGEG